MIQPTIYPQTEIDFRMRLMKQGGATSEDKAEIYRLYKKYIEPDNVSGYTNSSCRTCSSSILWMWEKIKELIK